MVSSRTENRARKKFIVRQVALSMISVMEEDMKGYDKVNMAKFKDLEDKVNEIVKGIIDGNREPENFTQDSKIGEPVDIPQQENIEKEVSA